MNALSLLLICWLVQAASSFSSISSIIATTATTKHSYEIETLSEDPKCYFIHNFLSPEECNAYITKADNMDPQLMTQSNAPTVSIQMNRLWPLPFLCFGAGVPPIMHLFEDTIDPSTIGIQDIISKAFPPAVISFGVVLALLFTVTKTMQKYAENSSRTSESVALNTEEDCDFIRNLVDRASAITNHKWDCWEAPVITKYQQGELFASHNDASPTRGSEWADLGGQRVVTVITYLNTCEKGGGTKFDKLGFQVQPRKGSAMVFFPAHPETLEADGRTVHQSVSTCREE